MMLCCVGSQQAGLHHCWAGKPETLEKLDAQALARTMLVGTFNLLGNQFGAGVAVGKLDQHRGTVRRQRGKIELDVVGQRQPGRIHRLQHRVVEGQMKALLLECQERGQAGRNLMHGGMAQRRDLQHHLVGRQRTRCSPVRPSWVQFTNMSLVPTRSSSPACVRAAKISVASEAMV